MMLIIKIFILNMKQQNLNIKRAMDNGRDLLLIIGIMAIYEIIQIIRNIIQIIQEFI